jgi:cell filamentation protein
MKVTSANRLGITDEKELEIAEGELTSARIAELIERPLEGEFDSSHLKSIHGYIFQDVYDHAGSFHCVKEIRSKRRVSEVTGARRMVFYPSIDVAHRNLDNVLSKISTGLTAPFKFKEIRHILIGLYANLDYFHIFQEGNSRTLRYFLTYAASRANLRMDWGTSNVDGLSRDKLYGARDYAVLKQVIHDVQSEAQLKTISRAIYDLRDQPTLEEVMLPMFSVLSQDLTNAPSAETQSEVCETCSMAPCICEDGISSGVNERI